jgi:hypothetical protein
MNISDLGLQENELNVVAFIINCIGSGHHPRATIENVGKFNMEYIRLIMSEEEVETLYPEHLVSIVKIQRAILNNLD